MEHFNSQAYSLRKLANSRKHYSQNLTRAIAITSGKGGVGKSNITINLGFALNSFGKNVTILDADFGLANVDVLLGKKPTYNINDVFEGRKKIQEIIMEIEKGLKIIPASSGIEKLANIDKKTMDEFISGLKTLEKETDFFLIDTSAGISQEVLSLLVSSHEVIVITTPEPTSITDAYAIIKSLQRKKNNAKIKLIVNMTKRENEPSSVFAKLNTVAEKFLKLKLEYIGNIPYDENVGICVKRQKPFLLCAPESPAAKSIKTIAKKLLEKSTIYDAGKLGDFFSNIKGFLK